VLADNFNFCGQERINNSLKTFMERELEKINERREKIDLFQGKCLMGDTHPSPIIHL
jgi:molybdenum cofactor biosynthesis enzyme MoaA